MVVTVASRLILVGYPDVSYSLHGHHLQNKKMPEGSPRSSVTADSTFEHNFCFLFSIAVLGVVFNTMGYSIIASSCQGGLTERQQSIIKTKTAKQ
jgi:hypothetical protein